MQWAAVKIQRLLSTEPPHWNALLTLSMICHGQAPRAAHWPLMMYGPTTVMFGERRPHSCSTPQALFIMIHNRNYCSTSSNPTRTIARTHLCNAWSWQWQFHQLVCPSDCVRHNAPLSEKGSQFSHRSIAPSFYFYCLFFCTKFGRNRPNRGLKYTRVWKLHEHHLTCGISSLLHSVNLILFTLLLFHLILRISLHHSHHLRSHHLSLPLPSTPDLKLISFTNPFLHSHSYSFRTDLTDLNLYWIKGALFCFSFWLRVLD